MKKAPDDIWQMYLIFIILEIVALFVLQDVMSWMFAVVGGLFMALLEYLSRANRVDDET